MIRIRIMDKVIAARRAKTLCLGMETCVTLGMLTPAPARGCATPGGIPE
jgi:hypothetical protein